MKEKYTLYKEPVSLDTLYIVQYLHSINIDVTPSVIIERSYPKEISKLPSIITENGAIYSGLDEVVQYYTSLSSIQNLLQISKNFKISFPEYRIN